MALGQTPVTLDGTVTLPGTVTIGPLQNGATLVSIAVAPANPAVIVGQSITFAATGTYSNGSTANLTTQAAWTVSGSAATNVGPLYTCNSAGNASVIATVTNISGSTTLDCQSVQIEPQGTFTAYQSTPFSQPFTASGGTPPYTFTASGLPGWLALSSSGCQPSQINCNLNGSTSTLGSYSFNLTATDSIGDTATIPVTVQVVMQSAEDDRYCNSDFVSTLDGQFDGPAQLLTNCVYDIIASEQPVPGTTSFVCPANQVETDGVTPVLGCAMAQQAGYLNYFNTVQQGMSGAPGQNNGLQCGDTLQIYARNWGAAQCSGAAFCQNVYNEKDQVPPTKCGPLDPSGNKNWIFVESYEYNSLPPPGSLMTPGYAGQTSLPGWPSYPNPAVPGIYVPAIEPTGCNPTGPCPILLVGTGSSGWRFMGIEFFEQKLTGPNGTAPGFVPPMIEAGCPNDMGQSGCNPGAQYIIFDRILLHGCQDKSDATCTDQVPNGIELEQGNYLALINSFCYGIKTLGDNHGQIGPTDETHCVDTGNTQNPVSDGPIKVVHDVLSADTPIFSGGGTSTPGSYTYDVEERRIWSFHPLTWFASQSNPAFAGGSVVDAWVGQEGSGYSSGTACAIGAPQVGSNAATCTFVIAGGKITGINITSGGSGYYRANPGITATDPLGTGSGFKGYPEDGIYIIKNNHEFKNGTRVLMEGSVYTNNWVGQSDEFGACMLLTPKNANNACPTCEDVNVTVRYNVCRNMAQGIELGADTATRCSGQPVCLPLTVGPASIHDTLFELNGNYWITQPDQFFIGAGSAAAISNNNQPATAINNIKVNHITDPHTEPVSGPGSANYGSLINMFTSLCGAPPAPISTNAVWNGITIENSIGAGGVKNTSALTNDCFQLVRTSGGGWANAMNSKATSSLLGPISAGAYTTNIVTGINLLTGGSCHASDPVTAVTISGNGTGATAGFKMNAAGTAVVEVYPTAVGTGYTTASVSFTGCSSGGDTQPTATANIGGAGNPSPAGAWCGDHNLNVTNAFLGEQAMTPSPTAQGDTSANNTCFDPAGGGNVDIAGPTQTNSVTPWSVVQFANFPIDANGAEIPTGDFHLEANSPYVNAGNGDNRGDTGPHANDMGADYDLVLQYTGCQLVGQQLATNGSIVSGHTTLTSISGPFTIGMVGAPVMVTGAWNSGSTLYTTIQSFANSQTVTLAAPATTTVLANATITINEVTQCPIQ